MTEIKEKKKSPDKTLRKRRPSIKQEKFCLNIISGMSLTDSYIDAYNAQNWTRNAVMVEASRLVATETVAIRIKELRAELAKQPIMSVQERLMRLTEIARENNYSDKGNLIRGPNIAAIRETNLMTGVYQEGPQNTTEIVNNFLFVMPDGTIKSPGQLVQRKEITEGEQEYPSEATG